MGDAYGRKHREERARWAPRVAAGGVPCSRCGLPIPPGSEWQLDHDDHDRTRYRGPSHKVCNLSAGGKLGNARRWAPTRPPTPGTTTCPDCRRPGCRRPTGYITRCW